MSNIYLQSNLICQQLESAPVYILKEFFNNLKTICLKEKPNLETSQNRIKSLTCQRANKLHNTYARFPGVNL